MAAAGTDAGGPGSLFAADDLAPLIKKIKEGREPEKLAALKDLAKLKTKAAGATRALGEVAVSDVSPSVRTEAQRVLKIVSPSLAPAMLQLAQHPDAGVCLKAAESLTALGADAEPAVPQILIAMRHFTNAKDKEDPRVVEACIRALIAIAPNDQHIVGELGQTAILHKDARVRLAAVELLATLAGKYEEHRKMVRQYYFNMFGERDPGVRAAMFREASKMNLDARSSRALLNAMRKDDNPATKQLADELEAKLKSM